ncbi:TerC family protein [Azospirillum tabaci]|uniref:TerC family protein n=1 Tax=Azospirillum tabaci TaxID=2752310 RepID=UPI001660390C|nr:TerC family protein [Azospirillum tabaci]
MDTSDFMIALLQIIWIDILLSGDNALVIALACRSLPPKQQKIGVFLGTGAAIVLRVLFAVIIAYLLAIPYLKIIGGALLFWIAIKLMLPTEEEAQAEHDGTSAGLWGVVRTIVIADAVMSLDNVIAIAAASHGNTVLLILGLAISIPLIVFGSTLILKAIERLPALVYAGAGLLGYIAAEVILTDPSIHSNVTESLPVLTGTAPFVAALGVMTAGFLMARSINRRRALVETDPA